MPKPDFEFSNGWKLEKRISVGDIIAIATALGMVFLAYSTLDKRVQDNTTNIGHNEKRLERVEARFVNDISDIKATLNRIEAKIDGKADKP